MAIYKVAGPDGRIREIEGPEGASDDEVIAKAKEMFSAPMPSFKDAKSESMGSRPVAQTGILNNLTGAVTEPVMAMASGAVAAPLANLGGLATNVYERVMKGEDTGASAHIKDFIQKAFTYQPRTAAGRAVSESPLNPLNALGAAVNATGDFVGNAIKGDNDNDTARGMVGNALGETTKQAAGVVAVPAAIGLARKLANYASPTAMAGRAATRIIGKDKVPAVIDALDNANTRVPGEVVTAGQAVGKVSPEFSGLADLIERNAPGKYRSGGIGAANEAARVAEISRHAGDTSIMKVAREAATAPLRDAALQGTRVPTASLVRELDRVIADPAAPSIAKKALQAIKDDVAARGGKNGVIDGEALYTVRKEIGNKIETLAKESSTWDKRLTAGVQDSVQTVIDDAIVSVVGPVWRDYLKTYSQHSGKIGNATAAKALRDSLTNPLKSSERPAAFAAAMDKNPLTSAQVQTSADAVRQSLSREANFREAAKDGRPVAAQEIGKELPHLPGAGPLSVKLTLTRNALNFLTGKLTNSMMERLKRNMDNPQAIADMLRNASASDRAYIQEAVKRYGPMSFANQQASETRE